MQPWISIATYNERENIGSLLEQIFAAAPQCHVIVTDDNSPDGTGETLDVMATEDPRVHVNHRAGKLGYASAHRQGMAIALDQGAEVVVTMDADFSHDPASLPALLALIEAGADMAIGSRYVPGGGTVNWPWSRKFLSGAANTLTRLGLGLRVRDCTGGFRAYRAPLLRRLRLDRCKSEGYSFLEESLLLCSLAGAMIAETPIIFADRRAGQSKISRKVILEAAVLLGKLSWSRVFRRTAVKRELLVDAQ